MWMGFVGLVPFVLLFLGLAYTKIPAWLVTAGVLAASLPLSLGLWKAAPHTLLEAAAEGAVTALVPIIWVIFAAVVTYFVSVKTGAIEILKRFLLSLTPDRNVQAVIVAFCFGGFLEAVAGFGTAVAIPTAMLIAIGFPAVRAAILALIANSVPVAFGALGIPIIALGRITGLDTLELTRNVAIQLLPFSFLVPVALVALAGAGPKLSAYLDALFIGFVFALVQTLIAIFIGPELVAVGASLASLGAFVAKRHFSGRDASGGAIEGARLLLAASNFVVLLALVLFTRLVPVPAINEAPFAFTLTFGSHPMLIDWLVTPGTLLLVSAFAGAKLQGLSTKAFLRVCRETVTRIRWSALTIVFILVLAKTMTAAGIIASVATTLAAISGPLFPLLSPILGAIGTFITGSDTSSNILFGELQKQTALKAGLNPEWLAAANTSGATAGKMISPQSIAVACSTVGIESSQGEILRKNIGACAVYVLVLGIYVLVGSSFVGP